MKTIRSIALSILLILVSSIAVMAAKETTLIKADPSAKITYRNPVWSPDGRSIAYVAVPYTTSPSESSVDKTGKRLYLAVMRGGKWNHTLLAKDADWPVWSPDGKQLAFNSRGLVIMNMSTRKTRKVVADKLGDYDDAITNYPLRWSRDGRFLLYEIAYYEDSDGEIYDLRQNRILNVDVGTEAAWMSGNSLLSSRQSYGEEVTDTWVRVWNPSGKSRTLLKGRQIWDPFVPVGANYAWVWISTDPPKGEGIYRMSLKNGELAKLLSVNAEVWSWSPDGKQFAFIGRLSERAGDKPQYNLYVGITHNWFFTIASRGAAEISGNWHDRMKYIGWAPDSKSLAYVTAQGDIKIVRLSGG